MNIFCINAKSTYMPGIIIINKYELNIWSCRLIKPIVIPIGSGLNSTDLSPSICRRDAIHISTITIMIEDITIETWERVDFYSTSA